MFGRGSMGRHGDQASAPPGGHKSLLKKSVSHSKKESVSHYTPPGGWGGLSGVGRAKVNFFQGISGQKSLKKFHPKSQSVTLRGGWRPLSIGLMGTAGCVGVGCGGLGRR